MMSLLNGGPRNRGSGLPLKNVPVWGGLTAPDRITILIHSFRLILAGWERIAA